MLSIVRPRLALLCALLASLSFAAGCSSDDDGGGSSSGGSSTGGGNSTGGGGSSGSTSAKVGDNCQKLADCGSLDTCLKVGGATVGFCTRSCTKNEDCPEAGFECNLSPYTACVPKQ